MTLPCGITGFWGVGVQPPPVVDVRAFRGHCHEAARRIGGQVLAVEEPAGHNYSIGTLATPTGWVAVLLNAHHPIVGFADPPMAGEVLLRFRDCPTLAKLLQEFGVYEVLAASNLERRPTSDDLGGLSEAERAQAAYWSPVRVGDLIFNWWD